MATRMQQRRGTAATWTSANPILAPGEIGFEIDTNKFKIGDGTSRWANLTYFTADAAQAIQDLIDGAPGVLDTLNELAAALGDDPAFFTTVATNLSNHESDTTNVHGIADTSLLATKSYADQAEADAISTASADATSKANAAQAAAISAAAIDATTKANAAEANAKAYTDARETAITTAYQSYANQAEADAIATAAADATTKANAAEAAAKSYADVKVADLIDSAPGALDTLNELAAAIGDDANYASTITNALALKAPLESPTFTGTVSGITKSMVGLGNVDNTSDANKPISTATQSALDLKAPIESPTFTGTVSGITKSMVGLGNVDNTSDANKPISTATQSALDLKAPLASPELTGVPTAPTAALGTNTIQVATTAFVDAAIEALASRNLVLDGGGV